MVPLMLSLLYIVSQCSMLGTGPFGCWGRRVTFIFNDSVNAELSNCVTFFGKQYAFKKFFGPLIFFLPLLILLAPKESLKRS